MKPEQGSRMIDGELGYFAYGANMPSRVFVERRGMKPTSVRVARLADYALVFDHAGLPIFDEAFANLCPQPGSEVWGVLYGLAPEALEVLDRLEGGGAYAHRDIEVSVGDGDKVRAVAYLSEGRTSGLRPSRRYLGVLLEGARERGLPEAWLESLTMISTSAGWVPPRVANGIPALAERLFRMGFPLRALTIPYWVVRRCLSREPPISSSATATAEPAATRKGHDGWKS